MCCASADILALQLGLAAVALRAEETPTHEAQSRGSAFVAARLGAREAGRLVNETAVILRKVDQFVRSSRVAYCPSSAVQIAFNFTALAPTFNQRVHDVTVFLKKANEVGWQGKVVT